MTEEEFTRVSFYIVAHADDWQLFMQPNAINDLMARGSKVVFIITTAGDAGAGEKYWASREEGMKSSIRFCLAPFKDIAESSGKKDFNHHTINYWSANSVTCYFLRLPDGNLDGSGFMANKHHSLSKLRAGNIDSVTSVDASATYFNWRELYTTLQNLILSESHGIPETIINYLNPDPGLNPNDHADHIATGQAILSMPVISTLKQALFVGYNVSNVSENLQGTDLLWKTGMFAAYEKAVFDASGYSTLREDVGTYFKWCLTKATFTTVNC